MPIQALIFDFDGTILDTETPEYEAWRAIYESYGVELPLPEWLASIGRGVDDNPFDPYHTLERLSGRLIDREGVRARRRALFLDRVAQQSARAGVVEYLDGAAALGLKLAVASSSRHDWVDTYLSRLGLLDRFDAVLCADDVTRTKPDPELYAAAVYRLGVEPAAAVAIEDSPNGLRAAKAAGLFCVATPNPMTALLPLDEAHVIAASLADLPLAELLARAAVRTP